jgi:hypothetical protein
MVIGWDICETGCRMASCMFGTTELSTVEARKICMTFAPAKLRIAQTRANIQTGKMVWEALVVIPNSFHVPLG